MLGLVNVELSRLEQGNQNYPEEKKSVAIELKIEILGNYS